MSLNKERLAIEQAIASYRQFLDSITDEQFTITPSMGGWSYAEVYDHIMKATLGSSIAMERCTHNNCPPAKKGLSFWGYYLMLTGTFPPGKIKVPEAVAAKLAPKKLSREEARNLIIKTRQKLGNIIGLVGNAPPNARWQHPRLGMLNAWQWLKFIRVHLHHHLKQLERIKNSFAHF